MSEFEGWTSWLEPAFLLWKPGDRNYMTPLHDPDRAKFSPDEELALMDEQIDKSDGFDIDFSMFRCVFNYHSAYLDSHEFVEAPETTGDLLMKLSRGALDGYNQSEGTKFEFVKVVKANFQVAAGIMFLITFQVKDPYDARIKLFRARVRHIHEDDPEHVFCRPTPDQQVECLGIVKKDDDVENVQKKQKV